MTFSSYGFYQFIRLDHGYELTSLVGKCDSFKLHFKGQEVTECKPHPCKRVSIFQQRLHPRKQLPERLMYVVSASAHHVFQQQNTSISSYTHVRTWALSSTHAIWCSDTSTYEQFVPCLKTGRETREENDSRLFGSVCQQLLSSRWMAGGISLLRGGRCPLSMTNPSNSSRS